MSAIDIFGFGRPASPASESRCATVVGDLWVAVSGDEEANVGWPCGGVVGVAEEVEGEV